jgi:hypothetical protein
MIHHPGAQPYGYVPTLVTRGVDQFCLAGMVWFWKALKNSSVGVVDVSNPTSPSVDGYISLPATSYPQFLESKGRYVYSISNTLGGMLSVIDTGGA